MDVDEWCGVAAAVYRKISSEEDVTEAAAVELSKVVLREYGRDVRDPGQNAASSEGWRGKPVSTSQRDILMEHGYKVEEVEEMTRGEASDVLDEILGGG